MRADSVVDIWRTTSPKPLQPSEFAEWYADLSTVRGDGYLKRLQTAMHRAFGQEPFKAFLMGHSGTGKSTELTRLSTLIAGRFNTIRLSATLDLNPASFQPLDVLFATVAEIVRHSALPVDKGGAGFKGDQRALERLRDRLGELEVTRERSLATAIGGEAGAGPEPESLIGMVLGLFATIKAEAKFASTRTSTFVEYQRSRLADLLDIANEIFRSSNAALTKANGKEWLVVWEDFEKPAIPDTLVKELFVAHGHLWNALECHLLLTLPMWLGYADEAARLPLPRDRRFVIPDPPVFLPDHAPDPEGRAALLDLLARRVNPALFEAGQAERCVVASGGNLRDLLSIVNRAADNADLRSARSISATDVEQACDWLRTEYLLRLGESPYGDAPLPYKDKVARLKEVYSGNPEAVVPDGTLYALLRVHAVQEFNHRRWLGVHPLVVDILQDQGHFGDRKPDGGTRG